MWLNEDEEEEDVADAGLDKCKSDYGKFMESEKGICANTNDLAVFLQVFRSLNSTFHNLIFCKENS